MTQDLQRFLDAQKPVYEQVCLELRDGQKRSHWMWFIFPQLTGLGRSAMAQHYALVDPEHARAYLAHPVLGARLVECVDWVNTHAGRSVQDIFGDIDAQKLRSCLTLFHTIAPGVPQFVQALHPFYGDQPDAATLELLRPR